MSDAPAEPGDGRRPDPGGGSVGQGDGDQLEYELDDWAMESRQLLRQLLVGEGVPHLWQGGRLVVPEVVESEVDALVDQVLATVAGTLADPTVERVAFDLADVDAGLVDELLGALDDARVAWVVGPDGALEVAEGDAGRVESLVEQLEFPHALAVATDEPGHGDDAAPAADAGTEIDPDRVLGGLFVAAGRLARDATEPRPVLEAIELGAEVAGAAAPFGFDPGAWERVRQATAALVALLVDASATNDDDVEAAAAELRDLLRAWV